MDINQLNTTKGFVDCFFAVEIETKVAKLYRDRESLEEVIIGQYG